MTLHCLSKYKNDVDGRRITEEEFPKYITVEIL